MRNFLTIMPLRTAVAQQMPDSAVVHTVAADSTKVFGKGLHDIVGDLAQDSPKFWVIQDIWEWLRHIGMGPSWANVLAFMITGSGNLAFGRDCAEYSDEIYKICGRPAEKYYR